jgi:hypothetical protein
MTDSPKDILERHPRRWAALVLAMAALAWLKTLLALPAFLVAALAVVALKGTPRRLAVVALALAGGAFGRFMVVEGAASIVAAGRRSTEEKALSRLREVAWAQERARELAVVPGGGYLSLAELTGRIRGRRTDAGGPFLADTFSQSEAGAWLSEGYRFAVFLVDDEGVHPEGNDVARAASHFLAYAWPAEANGGAGRAFFVDADDRICEARLNHPVDGRINPFAAFETDSLAAARCTGASASGWAFKPWKKKQPRAAGEALR